MNGDKFLPRPPRPKNTADFIVLVFVMMVAAILLLLAVTAALLVLFSDKDVKGFLTVITEMTKLLIAALVGYLAGKSSSTNGGS